MVKIDMKTKFVNESVEDVLKPKDQKKIIEDLAQEIMLNLLEGSVKFYYNNIDKKSPHSYVLGCKELMRLADENQEQLFDEYNKRFGPGLYVILQSFKKIPKIPMENIYPNRMVVKGTIQYDLPSSELETAIQELVAQVINGDLDNGFDLKYFNE